MNDVEGFVFTEVAKILRKEFEGVYVTGEYNPVPPSFPAVSIEETDNYLDPMFFDDTDREITGLTYSFNIYSAKKTGRKAEAKAILASIDKVMRSLNFIRYSSGTVDNMADASIYRLVATYRGETDGTWFYRKG